jgi:DNA-binding transcriptional LysR family regulator
MEWSDRIGRRIKLRDLHILLAVVQQGSMARAAKHLAVSQPVVSKVVADLEHVLGVRLLDRDRHGAEPTIYGEALLKHGVVVFDELRQSVKSIEFLTDPTAGDLRIGCINAMAAGLLPAVISLLHCRHPRLTFHVVQANTVTALFRDLRERNVDLILGRMSKPFVEDDLSADALFTDATLVVAGRGNKWIGRRKVELADLIGELWLLPPVGTAGEAISLETFRACGLEMPRRGVVCTSIQMHNALLASGPYLAMRPEFMVRVGDKHPSIKVLPVRLPVTPEPVGIITLKARTIGPVARLFIDGVREITKSMAGRPSSGTAYRRRANVS